MKKSKTKASTHNGKRPTELMAVLQMRPAYAVLLIALVTIVLYANSLPGQFVFDDTVIVQGNPAIHALDLEHLRSIFGGHYWQSVESQGGLYRPIVMLSYALNYALDGEDTQGYHLVNVLLHAANGILVYLILQALFLRPELSLLSALMFVMHPIRTEAVASVVGRAESLSAFFVLLAWWAYLRHMRLRRAGWLWVSAGSFVLAALTKESALSFVLLLPLTDYMLSRNLRGLVNRATVLRYLPFGIAAALVLGLRYWVLGGFAPLYINPDSNPLVKTGAWVRFLTATDVFARYLMLLIFPLNLSADYSYNQIPPVAFLFSWRALGPLLLLVLLSAGMVAALRRSRVLFFSGAVFFLNFVPTSNWIRPIGTIMAERLMYVPALGFNCALAYLLAEGLSRPRWKKPALGVAAILVIGYGLRTVERNPEWRSNYALFRSAADASPNSGLAQANCALVLLQKDDVRGALDHARKAALILPNDPAVFFTLGNAYRRLGNLPEAADAFGKVVQIAPRTSGGAESLLALAEIHEAMGRDALAVSDYLKLIEWLPSSVPPYLGLHRLYGKLGQTDHAREILNRIARIAPDNPAVIKALREAP